MYRISLINNNEKRVIFHPLAENTNRVIEAKLSESVSVFDTLTLSILSEYDLEITEMKTYIEVYDDTNNTLKFFGRVSVREKDMDIQGKFLNYIEAEGMLSLLNDSTQRPYSWTNTRLTNILNSMLYNHNNQKKNDYTFSCVIEADVSLDFEVEYENTYKYVQELIGAGNKEIYTTVDTTKKVVTIYVKNQIGNNKGARIRLGENMQSVNSRLDATGLATRVIPINPNGEEGTTITIKSVNNGVDYLVNTQLEETLGYSIEKVVENTELETPAELKEWGQKQLTERGTGELQITTTYLELAFIDNMYVPIALGDTVNVYNPALAIYTNVRAMAIDTDLFKPYNPTIELSTRQRGLTDNVLELAQPTKKGQTVAIVNTYTILDNITATTPITDTIAIPSIANIKDANIYVSLEKYTIYNETGVIQTTYPKDVAITINGTGIGTIPGNEETTEIFNIKNKLKQGSNTVKIASTQNGRIKVKVEITTN